MQIVFIHTFIFLSITPGRIPLYDKIVVLITDDQDLTNTEPYNEGFQEFKEIGLKLGNEQSDVGSISQIIDGGVLNSTEEVSITVSVSVHLVSELKKLPSGTVAAYGNVQVGDWAVFQDVQHPLKSLKMAFVIPPDLTESDNKNSCLILSVPLTFLPLSTRSSVCVPSFVNKAITHVGTISVMKSNGTNPICKSGAYLKLNYNPKSEQDFYLSKVEKWNVYLRLVHVSYFLFAVAVALICFSFLRTKTYTSVMTLDKVQYENC